MSNILAAIKKDNQEAADWLLYYFERRRQYYANKSDLLNSTHVPEISVHSGVSNPTMQKTMQLSSLLKDERWLETIELIESMLSEKKSVFLKVRREAAYIQERNVKGRPAWVVYVQSRYCEELQKLYGGRAERFWVSETTIKDWWQNLIELTARVAIKRGCL